jgi:hypothetical protein
MHDMASNYEKYKDVIRETNAARRAALLRLSEAHLDEYQTLYLEEALARGLKPTKIARMQRKAAAAAEDALLDAALGAAE